MLEIPLFKPHVDVDGALLEIEKVLRSGFINEGEQVVQLTKEIGRFLRTDRVCLTNSCTSALTMALKLAGVGPGDDVVTTPMTCVATNMPIKNVGANLIWADVNPESGMLTPATIERALTPRTKAVMVVMWAGNPHRLWAIQSFLHERGIKLILDAAHGFMSRYMGKHVHEYSDFCAYSFQAIKHITTGDGGALVCHEPADHERAKKMKWFGLDRDRSKDEKGNWKGQQWDVDIDDVGFKFNMNNLSAALGLSQVKHTQRIIDKHKRNAREYDELFSGCTLARPIEKEQVAEGTSWVYTILLEDHIAARRDEILRELNEEGVHAGVVHVPNDSYACFTNERRDLPGTRKFFERQLSLPCGWWMDARTVRYVFDRFVQIAGKVERG